MDMIHSLEAPFPYIYTALSTLAIVLLFMFLSGKVGQMRAKHKVAAPAMSGHPEFECANRVHVNSIEQAITFMPAMWLFAFLVSDLYAGIAGAIWVIGRILYAVGYMNTPSKRETGFLISFAAMAIPFLWSLYILILQLF